MHKKIEMLDDQLEIRIKPRILRMETCVAAMQGHYPDKREMHPSLPERKARRGCKLCEWLGFSSRKPTEEPKRPSANKLIPKDESLRKCWRDRDAFMMNEELPVIAEAVPEALADILGRQSKTEVRLPERRRSCRFRTGERRDTGYRKNGFIRRLRRSPQRT